MSTEQERDFESFLQTFPVGVTVWSLAGQLVFASANATAARQLRIAVSRDRGKPLAEVWRDATERERAQCHALAARGGAATALRAGVTALPLGEGRVAVIHEAHRANPTPVARFLDSVIDNLPAMIFIKSADELRFERCNRAGEELLGVAHDALLGTTDYDFFPAEQAAFFQAKDREVLAAGTVVDIPEEPISTPQGTRWLHTRKIPILGDDGTPSHLLGISMDITRRRDAERELERRVAERTAELSAAYEQLVQQTEQHQRTEKALRDTEVQLRHAQKLEAVGRLAGGIAHDFNNLLSVVLGYSTMLLEELRPEDRIASPVAEIQRAGDRAADLTRQLLAFSRQQVLEPQIVDLNGVLASIDRLIHRLIGEAVQLHTLGEPDLGLVRVDVGQLEQVVVNLVVNARDAMPDGGTLTIETANVELDQDDAAEHPGTRPGPHALLAVTDTGCGMDADTMARVFEPFFTTKPRGKGTGLGLSTVFGIVQQSGGSLRVSSVVGQGTTFRIYFPHADAPAKAHVAPVVPAVPLGRSETILLVEDEAQVRSLAQKILVRSGYQVIEARDPEEALARAVATSQHIDLLLTDVVMPGMSGRQLADRLEATRPGLKVLFMSGYTDATVAQHGVLNPGISLLQKPITPAGLTRKIREVLDA